VRLISAEERLAEVRGLSALIIGPTGVGKTSLVGTLDAKTLDKTLYVDSEKGDLPIAHIPFASIRLETWRDAMNLAAIIGGPNPALASSSAYSPAHYAQVAADPEFARFADYQTYVFDSLTAMSQLCRIHCEQLSEAITDRGKRDTRAVFGLLANHMLGWLRQVHHARGRNIILIAILERATDETNIATWQPQFEGQKTARELPVIVDEIITMTWIDFGEGKPPVRGFVCTSPNAWSFPAKDRSGKLDQIEPPDLGKLLAKITSFTISTTSSTKGE
jgi:hypothetical protein